MEKVAIQHPGELLAGFNDVLGQHMERLLGFKLGPAGMPLTVTTLACLALLSEREDDLKGSDAGARYTGAALLAGLSDLGLREYGDCGDILRQLKEKDYVRLIGEGGIVPNPVALRLEELFERIFPKMPGLNFVAYVTQTMGEVKSGRKELGLALSQFDQTLAMQGVSVVKRKSETPSGERPAVPQKDPSHRISSPQAPLPPRPRQEPTVAGLKTRLPSETQKPRVLGSAASSLQSEVREFTMGEFGPDPEGTPKTAPVASGEPANVTDVQVTEERSDQTEAADTVSSVMEEAEATIAQGTSGEELATQAFTEEVPQSFDRIEAETGDDAFSDQKASPIELDREEHIAQQIVAFEEELSLWCPLCNKDRVEPSTTPTGKTYYKCASRDCHFVSWGKPLHHPCPRCKNPFLIQISDKSGRMAYKCPRATCHFYRLIGEGSAVPDANGAPLRKVVRRRVVRRKR